MAKKKHVAKKKSVSRKATKAAKIGAAGRNKPKPKAVKKASAKTGRTKPAKKKAVIKRIQDDGKRPPVVGIGASAGGLEALEDFFSNMPSDTGLAFVVVTHQHPGHTSMLPEILGRTTTIPVVEATDGLRLEPDHIYISPSGEHLTILDSTLQLMPIRDGKAMRLPIDSFFRSLAKDQTDRAIGIVLSGTGTDGTLGLQAIKAESGMVMVQDAQSAKYAGMPTSAIATGLADYVLPTAAMPAQLASYAQGAYLKDGSPAAMPIPDGPMQKIFVLLRSRVGHDFSCYKWTTIRRRIERRMNVHQISKPDRYIRYLQEHPEEMDILFKELLISVTNFFRDPKAWDALAQAGLSSLLAERPSNYALRAWVPGCATGEEAYSVAILLHECIQKFHQHFEVQIFSTDLDDQAIETARAGRYPDGIAGDLSPQRLERYFHRENGTYHIRKEIREMVVFATQNVIRDPPFTSLDLICCRNLLIYLNVDLQKRLLPLFHYALKPGGLMVLGPSESIGDCGDLFETVNKRWKIFRRKEAVAGTRPPPDVPAQPSLHGKPAATGSVPQRMPGSHVSTLVEKLLLSQFVPSSVVVNDRGDIVFIHGRTGEYLEPASGHPSHNILEMAREGLMTALASALREAGRQGGPVQRNKVRVKRNGEDALVNVSVSKIRDPEAIRGLLLVSFHPVLPVVEAAPAKKGRAKKSGSERDAVLEHELERVKDTLQTTVEEMETSNEELKSTNEELQSTNEELQSTNEELETSKEEMQSLNEELTTVNAELNSKIEQLSQANNDMQNLLNSTDIATIFLDDELRIKRFTEEATKLVRLLPTDVGRPFEDLAIKLRHDQLMDDCRQVLKSLVFKEREVQTDTGQWYLMRTMPYRTTENVIDGLVITFVDIHRLKEAEQSIVSALGKEAFANSIFQTIRQPLMVLDSELRAVSANESFYHTFHTKRESLEGQELRELGNGQFDIPKLDNMLQSILTTCTSFQDFAVDHEFPKIGHKRLLLNARRLERETGLPGMILLAIEDVTDKCTTRNTPFGPGDQGDGNQKHQNDR